MARLLTFEADAVPDGVRMPGGARLRLSVAALTLILFGGLAAIVAGHGYRARIIGELVAGVFGDTARVDLNLLDSLGQAFTISTLLALRSLPGLTVDGLPVLTALAAAGFCAILAHMLDRQRWPGWQVFVLIAAVSLNPLFLKAATTGTTMLFSALAFFAVVYSCERLEHVGDVQAQMNVGLVLGLTVLVDPVAIYILMPVLTAIPVMYRDIRSPEAAFAAYLMVVLPALIAGAAFVFLHMIISPEPLIRPFKLWASPLHGAVEVLDRYDWILAYGGDFWGAAAMLGLGALVCVPGVAVLVWRFAGARAERASPGTAIITLFVPVFSGAVATSQVHARSAWPFVLAVLMAFLVWLSTKPVPDYVRRVALAAMLVGAGTAWLYPPLWAERGAAAWRTALVRPVAEPAAWPATPAHASWFDPGFGVRLLPSQAAACPDGGAGPYGVCRERGAP